MVDLRELDVALDLPSIVSVTLAVDSGALGVVLVTLAADSDVPEVAPLAHVVDPVVLAAIQVAPASHAFADTGVDGGLSVGDKGKSTNSSDPERVSSG
jgi:hypothetical protein